MKICGMKNISVIYQIISKVNNKKYIGSAVNYGRRINLHLHELRKNKHKNTILQNHFNKYGIEDLQFSVLESVMFPELLIEREQYYIDTLNPIFNIAKIAGSQLGIKRSNKTKEKMRETALRNGNTPPSSKDRKLSKEHIENLVNGHKKTCKTTIHHQYIKNNIGIKTQTQIAKELNIHQSTISKLLKKCT